MRYYKKREPKFYKIDLQRIVAIFVVAIVLVCVLLLVAAGFDMEGSVGPSQGKVSSHVSSDVEFFRDSEEFREPGYDIVEVILPGSVVLSESVRGDVVSSADVFWEALVSMDLEGASDDAVLSGDIISGEVVSASVAVVVSSDKAKVKEQQDKSGKSKGKTEAPVVRVKGRKPMVAVVIDDFGGPVNLAKEVASLKLNATWAIIPDQMYTKEAVKLAMDNGICHIIHMPMEAYMHKDKKNVGNKLYLIGANSSKREVLDQVERVSVMYPQTIGMNNHQGSAATSSRKVMEYLMEDVKRRGWVFMDSKTSEKSVAYNVAREYNVPVVRNSYFLDHVNDVDYMKKQFKSAVEKAKKSGHIVAICHVRPGTIPFLRWLSTWKSDEVELVTLDELAQALYGAQGGPEGER